MPPNRLYTQLSELPVAEAVDVTENEDGLFCNVGGVDSYIPFDELANLATLERTPSTINVAAYGAIGDGVVDDSAAIQSAVNALSLSNGGTVEFVGGKNYRLQSAINIPKNFTSGVVNFRGNGCRVTPIGAINCFQRIPTNQAEALNTMITVPINFDGFNFIGSGTVGSKGIELSATYGSVIERCRFLSLGTGLDLRFCLMTSVRNCEAVGNVTRNFIARYGDWSGATNANSQSNHTKFNQCRVYHANGALDGFYVFGSSGVVIEDCVTEGFNPVNSVFFDSDGSTVVKTFRIKNLHNENSPTNAVIRTKGAGGFVEIDTLYHQAAGVTLVDITGSASTPVLSIKNVVNIPATCKFNAAGAGTGVWRFENIGALGQADLNDTGYWVGATVPTYWNHRRNNAAGGIYLEEQGVDIFMASRFQTAQNVILGGDVQKPFGTKVLGSREAAVADATGAGDVVAQLNALLARMRSMGVIAP